MKTIEVTAKKVEDAIKQGLIELGQENDDDVDVEVVDQGGLFRKAKVRLTLKTEDAPVQKAEQKSEPVKASEPQKTEQKTEPQKAEQKSEKPSDVKTAKTPAQKPIREEKAKPKEQAKSVDKTAPKTSETAESKKGADNVANEKSGEREQKQQNKRREREFKAPKPVDPEAARRAEEFVIGLVERMGIEATAESDCTEGLVISFKTADVRDGSMIGHRGETLDSIQYLTELAVRIDGDEFVRLTVDCNGYRSRRKETIERLARRQADEAVRRNRKVRLEPMERIDRRTVHSALSEDERVNTYSEGKEPYRCIVIVPKRK